MTTATALEWVLETILDELDAIIDKERVLAASCTPKTLGKLYAKPWSQWSGAKLPPGCFAKHLPRKYAMLCVACTSPRRSTDLPIFHFCNAFSLLKLQPCNDAPIDA